MTCRNRCSGVGIKGCSQSMYGLGMKYCTTCEMFIFANKARCFCCGRVLRHKPNRKHQEYPCHKCGTKLAFSSKPLALPVCWECAVTN